MATYTLGSTKRIRIWIKDVSDVFVDPSGATTLTIYRPPRGVATTYDSGTITHEATGKFYLDVLLNIAGSWSYKAASVSNGVALVQPKQTFLVR